MATPDATSGSPVGGRHAAAASTLPISVIIPAYNRARMLQRSLASVWAQYPALPAQVIVVDDGSEDETSEVAASMQAEVIRHPENRGLSAARNSGLQAARQPWIALLDSDDEWLPHHLASLWALRGNHLLVAGASLHRSCDAASDLFAGPLTDEPVVLHSGDQLVYPGNIIPVSASMLKRQVALDVGGFRADHRIVEDFDMWLRLLERGTGICSPRVSIIYHVHAGQMSLQNLRMMYQGHARAAEAHRQRTNGSRTPLRRWEGVAAWDRLRDARRKAEYQQAMRWVMHIAVRPQRIVGVLGILVRHYRVRRRVVALRDAGVGV